MHVLHAALFEPALIQKKTIHSNFSLYFQNALDFMCVGGHRVFYLSSFRQSNEVL